MPGPAVDPHPLPVRRWACGTTAASDQVSASTEVWTTYLMPYADSHCRRTPATVTTDPRSTAAQLSGRPRSARSTAQRVCGLPSVALRAG